jgi:hypothetical protein
VTAASQRRRKTWFVPTECLPHSDAHIAQTGIEDRTQAGDTPRAVIGAPPAAPQAEMSEEEQARAALIDLRCLGLCIGMLERVNGVRFFSYIYTAALTH